MNRDLSPHEVSVHPVEAQVFRNERIFLAGDTKPVSSGGSLAAVLLLYRDHISERQKPLGCGDQGLLTVLHRPNGERPDPSMWLQGLRGDSDPLIEGFQKGEWEPIIRVGQRRLGEEWDSPGNSNPVTGTRVTRNARAKTCRIPGGNTSVLEHRGPSAFKGPVSRPLDSTAGRHDVYRPLGRSPLAGVVDLDVPGLGQERGTTSDSTARRWT